MVGPEKLKVVSKKDIPTIHWCMKKGDPAYQEQADGSVKPTVLAFKDKVNPVDISDILVPANSHLPQWYKRLNVKTDIENKETLSVKTCVSFINLFKNSYLFLSPVDFSVEVGRNGFRVHIEKDQRNYNFARIVSHTHVDMDQYKETGMQGESQLGPWFDKNYMNLKLDTALTLKSPKGRVDLIHMPCFWWNPQSPLQAVQGVLPIIDTYDVSLNINFLVRRDETRTITVKKGTPLAMYYSPIGELNFEEHDIVQDIPGISKYPAEAKKCPYTYNL